MDSSYVTVHRTYDPLQADMLGDLLRENGIAARVLGTRHGAVIGVGQNILQMHIEVPAEQAGPATDFLESFLSGEGLLDDELAELAEGADDEASERPGPASDRPRRPLLAAGSVLLIFGGSHLYARRGWTAAMLAVGQAVAFINMMSLRWTTVATGLVMFAGVLVLDLVGGQIAVRRHNRGARPSALRQMAAGAALVAAAGALAAAIAPRIPAPNAAGHWEPEPPQLPSPQLLVEP